MDLADYTLKAAVGEVGLIRIEVESVESTLEFCQLGIGALKQRGDFGAEIGGSFKELRGFASAEEPGCLKDAVRQESWLAAGTAESRFGTCQHVRFQHGAVL